MTLKIEWRILILVRGETIQVKQTVLWHPYRKLYWEYIVKYCIQIPYSTIYYRNLLLGVDFARASFCFFLRSAFSSCSFLSVFSCSKERGFLLVSSFWWLKMASEWQFAYLLTPLDIVTEHAKITDTLVYVKFFFFLTKVHRQLFRKFWYRP